MSFNVLISFRIFWNAQQRPRNRETQQGAEVLRTSSSQMAWMSCGPQRARPRQSSENVAVNFGTLLTVCKIWRKKRYLTNFGGLALHCIEADFARQYSFCSMFKRWSGAKVRKSSRFRKMLQKECLVYHMWQTSASIQQRTSPTRLYLHTFSYPRCWCGKIV